MDRARIRDGRGSYADLALALSRCGAERCEKSTRSDRDKTNGAIDDDLASLSVCLFHVVPRIVREVSHRFLDGAEAFDLKLAPHVADDTLAIFGGGLFLVFVQSHYRLLFSR